MMHSRNITKVFHKIGFNLVKVEKQSAQTWKIDSSRPFKNPNSCQIQDLEMIYDVFANSCPKTFVDVGAFDGFNFSNTYALAVNNWSGLMIEPDPESAEKCRVNLSEYPNVKVVETAVNDVLTEGLMYRGKELSTLNLDLKNQYMNEDWSRNTITDEKVLVECTTLDSILHKYNFKEVGVLSVDVEGEELSVWKSFNINNVRPRIMIWELQEVASTNDKASKKWNQVRNEILANDYKTIYRDRINTVFIDSTTLQNRFIL